MKVKNRKKNDRMAMVIKPTFVCPNCKETTTHGHFAPPSWGESGFFICEENKNQNTIDT
jgi:hypothetical protein